MSRETSAHDAVQALIPDDTIIDVALTYPRGYTKSQAYGIAAGGLIGGDDFRGVGAMAGSAVGGRIFTSSKELPPTIEHDVSVELEAKRLGNLGVKGIIELLTSG